ncbi:MAG: GDSL-type esterase/lipase family protein [Acutalibacteraceae bacterium]|nr:GDSL-type esterase/lipase family protein [Acutalibacteraceae bacterium]
MNDKWVQVWGQAHSAFSFFYYPSCKKTYRLVIKSALSGKSVRFELSNECAKNDVQIGALSVAKCDKDGNFLDECKTATVNSQKAFCLKKGQVVLSDEMELDINAGEYFCVNAYVEKGALRSGNLLDNANLLTIKGDVSSTPQVENQRRIRDKVREVASTVLKMYFHKPIPLFQSVQMLNDSGAKSIVVYGDSISQQGYWTNAFAERVYEAFPEKYSVINKSIMGTRLLRDFSKRFFCKGLFGKSGLNRLQRDILNYPDVEYVIIALGTNDFLQFGTVQAPKSEKPTAQEFVDGMITVAEELKKQGIKLIVFNILNFGESIDSRPEKEALVTETNVLLYENREHFYAFYDQAKLVVNPEKPTCSKKEYLGKDYVHPNKLGGKLVADNVDLEWFK